MTDYIERDDDCEQDCHCIPVANRNSDDSDNLERWSWLIDNWNSWSFKQKLEIFLPKVHYINVRQYAKADFDPVINEDILATAYDLCRDVKSIKFDPDRQGAPNILVVFREIYPEQIPDAEIRSSVISWGKKYGFLCS